MQNVLQLLQFVGILIFFYITLFIGLWWRPYCGLC